MEPLAEDIRYDIWWRVEAGYQSREEIIAAVVKNWSCDIWWRVETAHQSREETIAAVEAKWSSDDNLDELESAVRQATEELIAEHLREQAAWPAVTDYDRLEAAFADLNGSGILARQNYEQTLTSGAAAIWEEIRQEQVKRAIRGFVFFHEQDTEQAVRCDGPVLAWGAVAEEDSAWKELAEEIMAVLRTHGLSCSWAGSVNSRISIDGMRWQRRMSNKAEPDAAADRRGMAISRGLKPPQPRRRLSGVFGTHTQSGFWPSVADKGLSGEEEGRAVGVVGGGDGRRARPTAPRQD